jgi:adenylate cyclase
MVGYTRLMGADEEGTLGALKALRRSLIDPKIDEYRGRIVKATGDGVLVEFASAVEAVRCALEMQRSMAKHNTGVAVSNRIEFRIGVNVGDIMIDADDIFGDGVNIAARIEALAKPGGICIAENAYRQIEGKVAIDAVDLGEQYLKNVARPLRVYEVQLPTTSLESLPLPNKPSIAVMPFDNISGDVEQDYFSDGITEDIITELSKISGLFVIARHSAFTYKGKPVTLKQVGRELGVRYVLEGSVRKAGNRLRITAQLIDATTDHHLWAERYDRNIEDIFAVQDEVARRVADALAVTLKPGESERLEHIPTNNVSAYDLYLRVRARAWPPTIENINSARRAYDTVIKIDSGFAGGFAGKSITHSMAALFGVSDDRDGDAAAAMNLASQAMTLDPRFALSHSALGLAHSALGQHQEAVISARNAVARQPGDADSHAWLARCYMWAGKGEEAYLETQEALRLDPQYIEGPYLNLLGRVLFMIGRYQEAIDAYERNDARGGPQGHERNVIRAAAYGHLGQIEKARQHLNAWLRMRGDHQIDRISEHYVDVLGTLPDARRRIDEGLRKAGLIE